LSPCVAGAGSLLSRESQLGESLIVGLQGGKINEKSDVVELPFFRIQGNFPLRMVRARPSLVIASTGEQPPQTLVAGRRSCEDSRFRRREIEPDERTHKNEPHSSKLMDAPVAVVMAAGKGTRMKSDLPKVLVPVCDRPMIEYVLEALAAGGVAKNFVVVGHRAELVRETLNGWPSVSFADQTEQLGTGHAVMMCREMLQDHDGAVLVVAGDSPLMQSDSIAALLTEFEREPTACLLGTGYRDDPHGFGRVVRDADGNFDVIVEEKDATDEQRKITEVNLSCYVFNCQDLLWALDQLGNDNNQREYYVTDCPGILKDAGKAVRALDVLKPCESLSINTMDDLAAVEDEMRRMAEGNA